MRAAGRIDGMCGVRRGRKERASPLLESGDSGTESEQRFNTPEPASGYGEFKSLREIAVPQGDPAEQVPEVGGVSWQHPGEPDKPRQDPGDAPRRPR